MDIKSVIKKTWNFLVHDDSWASFIVDAILVLLFGKFILFPVLGLIFGTSFPVVAVVSGSMDHNNADFEEWWETNGELYSQYNITKEEFNNFYLNNGFEKGDVIVIKGQTISELEIGDTIIYSVINRRDPIIHRVVNINEDSVSTKGDANPGQIPFEMNIQENQIHGKAIFIIPYLGWVKVGFMEIFGLL